MLGTGQGNNSGNEVWLSLHSKEVEKPGQRWATIGSRSQSFVLREPVNVERPHPLPQVVISRFRLATWNETSAMQEGGRKEPWRIRHLCRATGSARGCIKAGLHWILCLVATAIHPFRPIPCMHLVPTGVIVHINIIYGGLDINA